MAATRTVGLIRSHGRKATAFALFALVLLTALALASSSKAAVESPPPPSVWSDKGDYAPGELVTLSGANWAPGESVHIRVNDDAGETWRRDVDVIADEGGALSDQFNLPNSFVAVYSVTATGASSGTATWSFTDALSTTTTLASNLNPSFSGQAVTFTATVTYTSTVGGHNAGDPVTEGTVIFGENGNANCGGSTLIVLQAATGPDTNGQVTFTTSTLSSGGHTIRACYSGTGGSAGTQNSAASLTQTVNACTAPSVTSQPTAQSITYGANATFTAAASGSPAPTVKWQVDSGSGFADISPAQTNTTLTLTKPTVSMSGNTYRAVFGNGCGSLTSAPATLTVAAKSLSVSFQAENKVYDANTNATIKSSPAPSLVGVVSGDVVTLGSGSASASFVDKNVGTGKAVTGSGFTKSGAAADNYVFASPQGTTTANITKAPLDISAVSDTKVYDGTTSSSGVPTVGLGQLQGADTVTGRTQAFQSKNVLGAGNSTLVVSAYVVNDGNSGGNYDVTTHIASGTITARDLTVSATGVHKVYDGNADASVNLSTNKVSGDAVTPAYTNASFNNKNVGTNKPVSVTGISISGVDAGNYNLLNTTASTTANVTQLGITGNFTAANKVYDGTATATVLTRSLTGAVAGDDVSLSGGTASFNNPSVGTNKTVTLTGASLTGSDAGNYSLTVNTTTANITAWNAQGYGFYQPVGADAAHSIFTAAPGFAPTSKPASMEWNTAKGGSTIPLKFNVYAGTVEKTSLTDTFGAVPFQATKLNSCTDSTNEDPVDFVTTGNTTLRYDGTGGQWIQNWKTPSASTDACYRAWVTFADGSSIEAFFKLKK